MALRFSGTRATQNLLKMQAPNSTLILRKSTLVTRVMILWLMGITLAGVTLYSRIIVCVCVLHVMVEVRKPFSAKRTSELELNPEG